jgi:hypothetical protein
MSYDASDTSELNAARRALGDITEDELLTDDEIEIVISEQGYNLGVAILAEGLAARYAQEPSSVSLPSGLSVSWAKRVEYFMTETLTIIDTAQTDDGPGRHGAHSQRPVLDAEW